MYRDHRPAAHRRDDRRAEPRHPGPLHRRDAEYRDAEPAVGRVEHGPDVGRRHSDARRARTDGDEPREADAALRRRACRSSARRTGPRRRPTRSRSTTTSRPSSGSSHGSPTSSSASGTTPTRPASPKPTPFVPLPPDKPANMSSPTARRRRDDRQKLKWDGGPWAHVYDIYFGTNPNPPLFAANQALGPSETTSQNQSFTLPALTAGTTYYWKIVSKTMAGLIEDRRHLELHDRRDAAAAAPAAAGRDDPGDLGLEHPQQRTSTASGRRDRRDRRRRLRAVEHGCRRSRRSRRRSPRPPTTSSRRSTRTTARPITSGCACARSSNSLRNDSVHVQFSDSVDSFGSRALAHRHDELRRVRAAGRVERSRRCRAGAGPTTAGATRRPIYFAADGTHTIRVQQREDGAIVDEIVLSPDTYLNASPGARDNDTTVLAGQRRVRVAATATAAAATQRRVVDGKRPGGKHVRELAAGERCERGRRRRAVERRRGAAESCAGARRSVELLRDDLHRDRGRPVPPVGPDARPERRAVQRFDPPAVQRCGGRRRRTRNADRHIEFGGGGAAGRSQRPRRSGWGWADNGWGAPGVNIYFATSGTHTIRVQQREDGAIVDQIVLSPGAYLNAAPGGRRDDATIISP